MPRFCLDGVWLARLDHGDERERRWLVDGQLTSEPVPDATVITGWVLPGLVDAHCHVGLDAHGAVPPAESEAQALADRAAGALLLRDAGSPADTRWIDDRLDLPRIIRAGRHIARPKRYLRNYADEVDPADLVTAVERQVARSDGWVKLVGDWIDRDVGDLTPLWPVELARLAIDRAHELGARVTAHVFGEQAATELVEAGIDGIEHGSGLTDPTIALMAERQVALVPTLVQLENFPSFAAAADARFPTYAAHVRALYASRHQVIGAAIDAGVPVYAGTDAGGYQPHGRVGDEIGELARICSSTYALGAGSWRARAWLDRDLHARGEAGEIAAGRAPDLVVYPTDPRTDLAVLAHPSAIFLRGVRVA
ncbi:MAG: amidohydrolase family protein [Propionibacteriaceae bacterium]